jgi:hypothetical protein
LSELADYRKIHGHCNVPSRYSKTTPIWEVGQRTKESIQLHQREDIVYDHLPNSRNGKLGFRMGQPRRCLEERLSELADYRKIHGHCNVPRRYSKTTNLGSGSQPKGNTELHQEGKTSSMTTFRIQELESLVSNGTAKALPGMSV